MRQLFITTCRRLVVDHIGIRVAYHDRRGSCDAIGVIAILTDQFFDINLAPRLGLHRAGVCRVNRHLISARGVITCIATGQLYLKIKIIIATWRDAGGG